MAGDRGDLLRREPERQLVLQLDAEPPVHRVQVDGGAGLAGDFGERGQDGRTRVDQRHVEVEPDRPRSAHSSPVTRLAPGEFYDRAGPSRRPGARSSAPAALLCLMTWESLLAYCLAKPGAWQDEPWEGDVVAKVGGKIFAFLGSGDTPSVGLKCGASREAADEWLLRYPDDATVMAYIGRSGWNTLRIGGTIPDDELLEAIDASYSAVVSKLPKKDRP